MFKLIQWIKDESIKIIPAIIYFCIMFNFIHFSTGLMLGPDDIRHYTYLSVTIGAIIMGKVLIIINTLPFIDAFPTKPLIYNILWKLYIYNAFIILFRITEYSLHLFFHGKSPELTYKMVISDILSPVFWSTQAIVFLSLLGFIVFTEIAGAIGTDKMHKMLFGKG